MSTPSNESHKVTNQEVKETLHLVIESLIDGQEGFQQIGEHLKDETLRRYFAAESLKRASFRGEIETLLHSEGDHNPKGSGSISGTLRRSWGDLKAHLGGSDHTLLETAEAAEDSAKKAYKEALEKELPLPVHQLLSTQYAHVQESHDYVKAARDSSK
ncbi:PA2169 family four-helix-bundle protein [Acidobacterium sp. S8]|uniref:PA2169 family four-helix-bundle protein n=1 Tax=Acidobacterium sp. S8 TaxID=1641854 RepID=UPI00131B0CD5|nr:PA2169 family four-helix-bundle protein [Acidobacterium sp. S8]